MMIKIILPLGLLGVLLTGCGGTASAEGSSSEKLEVLQELKESKLYKKNGNSMHFNKLSKMINASQGEKNE